MPQNDLNIFSLVLPFNATLEMPEGIKTLSPEYLRHAFDSPYSIPGQEQRLSPDQTEDDREELTIARMLHFLEAGLQRLQRESGDPEPLRATGIKLISLYLPQPRHTVDEFRRSGLKLINEYLFSGLNSFFYLEPSPEEYSLIEEGVEKGIYTAIERGRYDDALLYTKYVPTSEWKRSQILMSATELFAARIPHDFVPEELSNCSGLQQLLLSHPWSLIYQSHLTSHTSARAKEEQFLREAIADSTRDIGKMLFRAARTGIVSADNASWVRGVLLKRLSSKIEDLRVAVIDPSTTNYDDIEPVAMSLRRDLAVAILLLGGLPEDFQVAYCKEVATIIDKLQRDPELVIRQFVPFIVSSLRSAFGISLTREEALKNCSEFASSLQPGFYSFAQVLNRLRCTPGTSDIAKEHPQLQAFFTACGVKIHQQWHDTFLSVTREHLSENSLSQSSKFLINLREMIYCILQSEVVSDESRSELSLFFDSTDPALHEVKLIRRLLAGNSRLPWNQGVLSQHKLAKRLLQLDEERKHSRKLNDLTLRVSLEAEKNIEGLSILSPGLAKMLRDIYTCRENKPSEDNPYSEVFTFISRLEAIEQILAGDDLEGRDQAIGQLGRLADHLLGYFFPLEHTIRDASALARFQSRSILEVKKRCGE